MRGLENKKLPSSIQGTVSIALCRLLEALPTILFFPIDEGVWLLQLRFSDTEQSQHLLFDLSHVMELARRPWCHFSIRWHGMGHSFGLWPFDELPAYCIPLLSSGKPAWLSTELCFPLNEAHVRSSAMRVKRHRGARLVLRQPTPSTQFPHVPSRTTERPHQK